MSVVVILNRVAEGKPAYKRVAPVFEANPDVEIRRSATADEGVELARRASCEGKRLVIAVGGDGSIQSVVRGLVSTQSPSALAVVPAGRGNDLARSLGVAVDAASLAELIQDPRLKPLDVGRARVDGVEHVFVNALGIGFDGAIADRARSIKLPGLATYGLSTLLCVARGIGPWKFEARLEKDEAVTMESSLLSIGNGSSTGGGFRLTPDADPGDGWLDYCWIPAMSRTGMALTSWRVLRGAHRSTKGIRLGRLREADIRADPAVPVHADGEVVSTGARRIELRVDPGALRLALPSRSS